MIARTLRDPRGPDGRGNKQHVYRCSAASHAPGSDPVTNRHRVAVCFFRCMQGGQVGWLTLSRARILYTGANLPNWFSQLYPPLHHIVRHDRIFKVRSTFPPHGLLSDTVVIAAPKETDAMTAWFWSAPTILFRRYPLYLASLPLSATWGRAQLGVQNPAEGYKSLLMFLG